MAPSAAPLGVLCAAHGAGRRPSSCVERTAAGEYCSALHSGLNKEKATLLPPLADSEGAWGTVQSGGGNRHLSVSCARAVSNFFFSKRPARPAWYCAFSGMRLLLGLLSAASMCCCGFCCAWRAARCGPGMAQRARARVKKAKVLVCRSAQPCVLNKVQLESNVHPFDDQNLKPCAFNLALELHAAEGKISNRNRTGS